jgi:hypothetical protein
MRRVGTVCHLTSQLLTVCLSSLERLRQPNPVPTNTKGFARFMLAKLTNDEAGSAVDDHNGAIIAYDTRSSTISGAAMHQYSTLVHICYISNITIAANCQVWRAVFLMRC